MENLKHTTMKRILFLAVAVFALFACSKEDSAPQGALNPEEASNNPVFYAGFENSSNGGTKVYADENMRLKWNAADHVSIFVYNGKGNTLNSEYEFAGEDGDAGGMFTPVPSTVFGTGSELDHIYAVYPYSIQNKIDHDGVMTLYLPSEQTYKEGSFGIGANTMVAVTDDTFLPFKNVCGYLKLSLWGDNIKIRSIKLEGNNGEKLAGKATVVPGTEPAVTMDGSATESITLYGERDVTGAPIPVPIGSSSAEATDFYLVVPPTAFSGGFTITVTDEYGGVFVKTTTKSNPITRNNVKPMPAMEVTPDYTGINVEFSDAAFKAYCVENFDSDEDGDISIAEAEVPTAMDVSNLGIRSMKGLECFVNLTYLDCNVNQITELDVSNLTHLETLLCNGNQLTSLDLSSNTALEQVYCTGNRLSSLNLGSNSSLTILNVTSNQLSSLDLSGTPNLNTVIFSDNHIRNIDLTACPDLTLLRCSDNLLSSIDLSNNTALTELDVSNNRLTSLDLTANTALVKVNCVSNLLEVLYIRNHSALQELRCGSNARMTSLVCRDNRNLTLLNVRGNTSLQSIDVTSNKLQVIGEIKTCTSLETLLCGSNMLTDLDVSDMTSLKVLHAAYNGMTSINVSGCTALEDLDCRRNSLTTLDVTTNTYLSVLSCEFNSLTSLDVSNNLKLVELKAQNNQLASISFTTLLGAKVNLQTLWVQNNQLTTLDLSKLLKLETLYCHDNSLSALSVVNNTNLTKLAAWSTGATGSIARLSKASGQNITYLASDHSTVINPTGEPWNTLIANL